LPDKVARKDLLRIMLKNERLQDDINIDKVVDLTEMFSGDDIKNLCRDASMAPLRRWMMNEGIGLDMETIKSKEQELKETPIS
jgi:SpoVK/Ycf46/Vps4 family AAA+-type ATPase